MQYDVVLVIGELFFDHPLCGAAILKRLLEKYGYSVGLIEIPEKEEDIKQLGKPKLFFGIGAGSIDSMIRNYTPLKRLRSEDEHANYDEQVKDRAITVYCNWIRKNFKDSILVLGSTEATLRRFTHFDYWENRLRKPILFDSRGDILAYGNAEKQILEIAKRISNKETLTGIPGTCIISKEIPPEFTILPSYEEVFDSKEKFCDMQNLFSNTANLAQKIDNRYLLQYKSPVYTSADLDEYYALPFTRSTPRSLRGFEFSVVSHRGCIGECNFCALRLTQGDKIISRSEESILDEIKEITKLPHFKGNIDDLGGPSANMYRMDCHKCQRSCLDCKNLDRSNKRLIALLKKAEQIPGVKHVYIKSGVRYDLSSEGYIQELKNHVFDTIRIAPEHVNKKVLQLMNKDRGNLKEFTRHFRQDQLSFYFMTAHPGSGMKEAEELARVIKGLRNAEHVQIFMPTPMTVSTCMYYTSLDPKTKEQIYVPYTYNEKKRQKRVIFSQDTYKKDLNS
ncbi:MAG: YgiQ family radical SAM protein [Candidatus Woesearchaeota archaeon]